MSDDDRTASRLGDRSVDRPAGSASQPAADGPAPGPAPPAAASGHGEQRPPFDAHPDLRSRLHAIAERLRNAAEDLGGEVMIELPSRLGDHEGLLLALANELEQLVK